MHAVAILGAAAAAVIIFLLLQFIGLGVVLATGHERTNGLAYYGLPPAGRARYRATLRRQARALYPILRLIARFSTFTFEKASFRVDGMTGPRGTCSEASFRAGMAYEPRPEDVFVVTQMKCGTTWMQHVVYQVLQRGRGDIVETGGTLYAVSPWLEALKSVPVAEAPRIGAERPARIIKTHLPAHACPFSDEARYIYVARHPVSCFASCVDFIATNAGAMAPPLAATEAWFCSDDMWWGSWPAHVHGWWSRAQTRPNVLFVHFETMKADLASVVRDVASFLGVPALDDAELATVLEKCSFGYMKRHADTFEMHPPHLLQTDAELFVRGSADRHHDVPRDVRNRIFAWCAAELKDSGYPFASRYGTVATAEASRRP